MKKRIAYIFLILLVITGILYTWDFNKTRTSHGFLDVLLGIFYGISSLSFFVLGIVYQPMKKFVILSVSTIIIFFTLNILLKQDFMKSRTILSVRIHHVSDSIPDGKFYGDLTFILDFKKNNRCVLNEEHWDFSYSYPYDYFISNDTINIDKEIIIDSDSALTTKYILDRENKIITPVEKNKNKLPCLEITYDDLEK